MCARSNVSIQPAQADQSPSGAQRVCTPTVAILSKASKDVWELFRTVIRERKAREFDPTIAVLRVLTADAAFANEPADARARIRETLALMNALSSWGEEMLRREPATLMKVMKLGGKIRKLLRDGK